MKWIGSTKGRFRKKWMVVVLAVSIALPTFAQDASASTSPTDPAVMPATVELPVEKFIAIGQYIVNCERDRKRLADALEASRAQEGPSWIAIGFWTAVGVGLGVFIHQKVTH